METPDAVTLTLNGVSFPPRDPAYGGRFDAGKLGLLMQLDQDGPGLARG